MIAIFDNGHGINTPGKRSPEYAEGILYEYEFNRDIVRRVSEICGGVLILVPEIGDISLAERCRRANNIHDVNPDTCLVSIHANAGGGKGWEVFTSKGNTRADKIADIFIKHLKDTAGFLRADWSDGDADKEADFYILKNTTCPAILIEAGFMDNREDYLKLRSPEFRQKFAQALVNAVKELSKVNI